MASDRPENSSNAIRTNVQVKIEPGTSSTVSAESPLLKNIKMEPGLPTTTQRLTSFRLPRDLTLGGNVKTEKPKKVYTPNLNAQRNKKKDDAVPVKVDPTKRDSASRNRGRGRIRGDRGRGRGNLIQSVGVWSEGINASTSSRRSSSTSRDSFRETKKYVEKPKLNLNKLIDKTEDEDKFISSLLNDDYDDGADNDNDNDYDFITLDTGEEEKIFKKVNKIENDARTDEDTVEKKPVIAENGEVVNIKVEQKFKDDMLNFVKKHPNEQIPEIIENKNNSYILIQLPYLLPGLESNKEEPRSKRTSDSRLNSQNASDNKAKVECCTLNSLKNGLLGKLEILKSGKIRLRLGENNMIIDVGLQSSIRQDLLAAKVDTLSLSGDLINLGSVKDKLICSLDIESMLEHV